MKKKVETIKKEKRKYQSLWDMTKKILRGKVIKVSMYI